MNEMRKLMEAVESAQGGTPVTESQMKTYNVKYTVTVNLPVKAEDEDEAEEKFFDYLFENELQMDHNFGLDLGEVTITPMDLGEASETDGTDDPYRHFSKGDVVDHHIMGKVTVLAVTDQDIYGMPAEFRVRKQDGSELVVDHDYLAGYYDENLADLSETDGTDDPLDLDSLVSSIVASLADWNGEPVSLDALRDEGIDELLVTVNKFDLADQFEALDPDAMDYVEDQVHKQIRSLRSKKVGRGDHDDLRRPGNPNIRPT